MTHNTIVLKFGGASVSTPESFHFVSDIICERKKKYKNVVVVVSAMGETTDDLIALAKKVNPNPPRRELDMLISTGERQSIALLCMALALKNIDAVSFTGSQAGIITSNSHFDAKILDVRPKRILDALQKNKIVIVAGFQGMSLDGDITTLGRGGTDTTAVALAVALQAEKVEFFKDVNGIYDKDPKKFSDSTLLPILNYTQAYEIMKNGAQVLHDRCIAIAEKNHICLHVLSFNLPTSDQNSGTYIQPSLYKQNNTTPAQPLCVYETI